jgi:hypothetical protein
MEYEYKYLISPIGGAVMAISIKTMNDNIVKAGGLDHRIIGIYSQDTEPAGAVTVAKVVKEGNPCVAKALFTMAANKDVPAIYVGGEAFKECCWATPGWFGYKSFPPKVEQMFASDSPNPNSWALKKSMDICRETLGDIGRITPPGKYVVMRALSDAGDTTAGLLSILCFGKTAQIKNLGALIHFSESKIFTPIMAPWGSGCSMFVTYPAGLASNGPKDTAFLSPMSPESNDWLPKDILALGIPIDMAVRMAEGYEKSFLAKNQSP